MRHHPPLTAATLAIVATLGPAGCIDEVPGDAGNTGSADQPTDRPARMSDLECLRKMSLDLTHRGPTSVDMTRLAKNETSLDKLADEYLASPEFAHVAFDW